MSTVIQQALFTHLCRVGIPMHETISIIDDLDEILGERLESNLARLVIFEQFHCLGKTI